MDRPARPLLPAILQGAASNSAAKTEADPNRYQRKITPAACKACQRNKTRCDGVRPKCDRCESRNLDCEWEVEQGVGRYATLKLKNAKLEQDLASLHEQFRQIQSKPQNDTADLVDSRPSNLDVTCGVKSFGADKSADLKAGDANTSTVKTRLEPVAVLFNARRAATDFPGSGYFSGLNFEKAAASTNAPFAPDASASVSDAIRLHCIAALKAGFEAFFSCTGPIFYVYTKEEGNRLQQDVLEHLSANEWLGGNEQGVSSRVVVSLAEMCGMAAVGLQYTTDPIPGVAYSGSKADRPFEFTSEFYRIAKKSLDEAIEFSPLRAMKLCTVLSMYNIITHSSVALAYAEMGINLGEHHGLHHGHHATGHSRDDSVDYRRVLRTLIMLRSWLVSTLGYLPANESVLRFTNSISFKPEDMGIEDILQHHMAKVTIIKSRFMQTADNLRTLSPILLRNVREDLASWHDQLPKWMKLKHMVEGASGLSDDQQRVIYFAHLFYLSAIVLKSRIVHGVQRPHCEMYDSIETRLAVTEGIEASRSSARILQILLTTNSVFKKCWLCIFQSYMSGISLLYAVTRRLQGNCPSSTWKNDVVLAKYCLEVLEFCATADKVAETFYGTLKNALDKIRTFTQHDDTLVLDHEQNFLAGGVDQSLEHMFSPLQQESALYDTACALLAVLRQPFADFAQRPIPETMACIEEISVGAHVDWFFEVSSPLNGESLPTGGKGSASFNSGTGTTRFLQNSWYPITSNPYGWSNSS